MTGETEISLEVELKLSLGVERLIRLSSGGTARRKGAGALLFRINDGEEGEKLARKVEFIFGTVS
jgi:hypothetical protein